MFGIEPCFNEAGQGWLGMASDKMWMTRKVM